ncbi:LysR family transcriptional regulator [Kutzneria buriramensis]|uniref:DNA-binding transcriptional LysR family regulator n=1 Tax=Kutzneria buriramensis TaxID=1045776 RepID=A0A3E0HAU2_9PSEU|nr:LysR family transcriptional regulator [Kutzneria buriramensis]REH41145.1 DNA-binding transcriptional LysR family regulator [Kutzneria buriramensis]
MLDPARLRVLVEIGHAGSISAAAARLAFTPSALSQQLAKLERELGCRLVERGPTGVTLTRQGKVLLRHGERVLGELRDAERAVRASIETVPESLSIGTFSSAGKFLVPEALAALRERHPRAQLSLVDIEPPGGYGLVTSRDLDVLITHRYPGGTLPSDNGLHRKRLLADPLRLVLPAGHRLAHGKFTWRDLGGEDWISGAHGVPNRVCLEHLATQAGIRPHVAYETRDYEVTLALVTAGLGISLVPVTVLGDVDCDRLAVRVLPGIKPAREIFVVHRKRPPRLVAELVGLLTPGRAR